MTSHRRSIVTVALSFVVSETFDVEKCRDLEIRVRSYSRSSKVIPFDKMPMTSYQRSIATMGLYPTILEINGDINRKSQIFAAPVYWRVPLGIEYQRPGAETRMMGLPGRERSLIISSTVLIQYTNVTDGQTDTRRQQRSLLRLASRDKKESNSRHFVYFC